MNKADVILLVKETQSRDEYGVLQTSLSDREVFCEVAAITQKEFFRAGEQGLKPQYRFTLSNEADYNGEKLIKFHGKNYSVYRTYVRDTEAIELYVEEKAGD